MAGSEAEERIRAKAEAALREEWPDARIIHELMLQQGGCRIDLAAVTRDRIIAVEIKSERDTLDRLKEQARQAELVADYFTAVVAEKHYNDAWQRHHVSILAVCKEDDARPHFARSRRFVMEATCNAPARLQMLWAEELRRLAETGARASRSYSIRLASETLTGAEVRRRVCAMLRARSFPRADPAIALPESWAA